MKIFAMSIVACLATGLALPCAAQSTVPAAYGAATRSTSMTLGSSTAGYEDGYDDARSTMNSPFNPSTRDANGNRIIANGLIQTGSTYTSGASSYASGASAQAVGNMVNVQVTGSWNTVILNSTQINQAPVTASNTVNGKSSVASAVLN